MRKRLVNAFLAMCLGLSMSTDEYDCICDRTSFPE